MNKRRWTGLTLFEVLVVISLFALFLSFSAMILVRGYRTYTQGTNRAQVFREATLAMMRMSRELTRCSQVLYPSLMDMEFPGGKRFVADPILVFTHWDTRQNIGYRIDDKSHTLYRYIYSSTFDINDSATWVIDPSQTKILARSVQQLRFFGQTRVTTPFDGRGPGVVIYLTSYPDQAYFPLRTSVQVRSFYADYFRDVYSSRL